MKTWVQSLSSETESSLTERRCSAFGSNATYALPKKYDCYLVSPEMFNPKYACYENLEQRTTLQSSVLHSFNSFALHPSNLSDRKRKYSPSAAKVIQVQNKWLLTPTERLQDVSFILQFDSMFIVIKLD